MWLTAGNLFHTVKLLVDSNVVKDMNKLKYYFLCLYIKMIRGSIDDDLFPYVIVLPCQHILHRKRFLNLVKAMLGFFGVETCGKKDLYLFVFFGFLLPQSDRGFK